MVKEITEGGAVQLAKLNGNLFLEKWMGANWSYIQGILPQCNEYMNVG